jgi:SAM-dependent methyltransferase
MPFTPPPLLEPLYIILLSLCAHAAILWTSPFPLTTLSSRSGALFQKILSPFPHPTAARQITLHARGVVLDLGPGLGLHLPAFREPVQQGKIKKIYGFEPNSFGHADLKENVKKEGLEAVYEIVDLGVEDAVDFFNGKAGNGEKIEDGFVDTVICIHVLCSVPRPQEMIRTLWRLLKKDGGQMLVWEHVSCRGRFLGRLGQGMLFIRTPWSVESWQPNLIQYFTGHFSNYWWEIAT